MTTNNRQVITALAASLLVSTGAVNAQGPTQDPAHVEKPAADAWKTDPKVHKAADRIYPWLQGVRSSSAKSTHEVQDHFRDMQPDLVATALRYLVYDGRLKRIGDGSRDAPFMYYELSATHLG